MDTESVRELVEKITQIDGEIKLLQEDRKSVLDEYKDKLDLKAFKAALRIVKPDTVIARCVPRPRPTSLPDSDGVCEKIFLHDFRRGACQNAISIL